MKLDKAEKIIDSLGLLYPQFSISITSNIIYKNYTQPLTLKFWWLCLFCIYKNQRLPQLEKLMRHHANSAWYWYCRELKLSPSKCGIKKRS